MIDDAAIRRYLNQDPDADVSGLLAVSEYEVDRMIGVCIVPEEVRDRAVLEAAASLDLRRQNPGGIVNYAGADQPQRLARDPMVSARAVLSPWLVNL